MRLKHRKCILYIFFLTAYGFISVIYLQSQSTQEFTIYDDVPDWESRLDGIKSYCNNSPVLLQKPRQLQAAGVSEQKANHFTKIFQSDLLKNIVRIPSLRLDWCLVPKVASTSISQLLLRHLPKTRDSQSEPLFIQKEVWERAGRLTWQQYTQAVHFTRFFDSSAPVRENSLRLPEQARGQVQVPRRHILLQHILRTDHQVCSGWVQPFSARTFLRRVH